MEGGGKEGRRATIRTEYPSADLPYCRHSFIPDAHPFQTGT